MIIYLLGFMGSGKSTAGRKLAGALGYEFFDLDHLIERERGVSIGEIFRDEGEPSFRITEAAILRKTGAKQNTVIACGGGTPCFHDNMGYMNSQGLTVYLEMTPGQLMGRLSASVGNRPLISSLAGDDLLNYITGTLEEREQFYRKASLTVRGLSLDIQALVKSVQENFLS
ncbi:MAG: shikimate kinase [Bacteroidia bacterium]|nr:MAG: shikimate kinase [Bacteroidia bacterium]